MRGQLKCLVCCSALALMAGPALAQSSQGDWTVGLGVANVNPKSNNGTTAAGQLDIQDANGAILTGEYFVADNIGIELLLATRFKHDFKLNGANAGNFKLLPPTLSANYHFDTGTAWKPYVGVGVTYAYVSSETLTGSTASLDIDNSWGIGAQVGIDYQLSPTGALRFTARYIDLKTDVKVNGGKIGEARVDPVVLSASYVFSF